MNTRKFDIYENEEVCANCKHFVQHYVWTRWDGFIPCNGGHCTYPHVKDKKPGMTGCEYFELAEKKEQDGWNCGLTACAGFRRKEIIERKY